MQIQITGRKIEVTDALKDHVNAKMSKLERHFDHITQVHVMLKLEHDDHIAEAKVNISGGELFAQSSSTSMYASVDLLIDKLDRQIIKHKEKLQDHTGSKPEFLEASSEEDNEEA